MSSYIKRRLVLLVSSGLLLVIVGGSLWFDRQIRQVFKDSLIALAIYSPPQPPEPSPNPSAEPGTSPSPPPPPPSGTCGDGACSSALGENEDNCPSDCRQTCDLTCNSGTICCNGTSCSADSTK